MLTTQVWSGAHRQLPLVPVTAPPPPRASDMYHHAHKYADRRVDGEAMPTGSCRVPCACCATRVRSTAASIARIYWPSRTCRVPKTAILKPCHLQVSTANTVDVGSYVPLTRHSSSLLSHSGRNHEHYPAKSQPWVGFRSSSSTHNLLIPFLADVHTRTCRYLTVLKSESHCVVRNTFHSHLPLVFPQQRTQDAFVLGPNLGT